MPKVTRIGETIELTADEMAAIVADFCKRQGGPPVVAFSLHVRDATSGAPEFYAVLDLAIEVIESPSEGA